MSGECRLSGVVPRALTHDLRLAKAARLKKTLRPLRRGVSAVKRPYPWNIRWRPLHFRITTFTFVSLFKTGRVHLIGF